METEVDERHRKPENFADTKIMEMVGRLISDDKGKSLESWESW